MKERITKFLNVYAMTGLIGVVFFEPTLKHYASMILNITG